MQITIGEPPSDLPAWIQAIGSVLAILIAIYIPYAQRKGDTKRGVETKKHLAAFITGHIDFVIANQTSELTNFINQFAASFKTNAEFIDWVAYATESLAAASAQTIELERFKSLPISDWPNFEAASRYFELCYENRDLMQMINKNWQLEKIESLVEGLRRNLDGFERFMQDGSNAVKDAFQQAGLIPVKSKAEAVTDEVQ